MERAPIFDGLRLLGALLVLLGHSYVLTGYAAPTILGTEIHSIGVKLFFLISGYLITASYLRDQNLVRFAVKRAARIMPALVAVVIATVIVMAFVTDATPQHFAAGAALYLARNVLLLPYHVLPGVFESNPYPRAVNGSLWTLPVEALMYAATPQLTRVRPMWLLPVAAVIVLAIPVSGSLFGFGLSGAASVVPFFLLGSFAQRMRVDLSALRFPKMPADLSYGIYLTAFPLQQLLVRNGVRDPLELAALTLSICAPIAWMSWNFIELPALTLAKRFGFVEPIARRSALIRYMKRW